MSGLGEKRWAVMSERGCEVAGVVYAEALEALRKLKGEKLSGLCVITERAAGRLETATKKTGGTANGNRPKRQRRTAKDATKNKGAT